MKILLIEDEAEIADFVREGLFSHGVQTTHAGNGHIGFDLALNGRFDVIVLDIMLPGRDGLSVLEGLRQQGIQTPVILLTARNELGDRVRGLDLGADDYLAKPFYVDELFARLNALTRRDRQASLEVGELRLDRLNREAQWEGRSIDLTGREFSLLEYLMRSPGEVFTRGQILEHVWGYDFDPNTNLVDVCVKRIRHKLEGNEPGSERQPIETVRGVGYRFRRPA